jgi:hypothetical protein
VDAHGKRECTEAEYAIRGEQPLLSPVCLEPPVMIGPNTRGSLRYQHNGGAAEEPRIGLRAVLSLALPGVVQDSCSGRYYGPNLLLGLRLVWRTW